MLCVALQALTIKLQKLRHNKAGSVVDQVAEESIYDEESDFSDDEL